MNNFQKLLTTIVIALAITITQITPVAAQSGAPVLPWTIDSITPQTDPTTGETTAVVVVLTDDIGGTQTVSMSVADAEKLGLVTTDPTTGKVTANDAMLNSTIDPALLPTSGDEAQHPVGSKLSEFFTELLGVDYDTIMAAHEDGFGFGVIAQALWMTKKLGGDTDMFQAILAAKQSGDYSATGYTNPDGSVPTNWGQFKKAVMAGDKGNLGCVMSGKTDKCQGSETVNSGNANDNDHGNGKDKENGKNKEKEKGKDKDKGKDKGKGK